MPSHSPDLDRLRAVPLELTVLLGARKVTIGELLELGEGSVVELDRAADAPVEVLAGGAVIARGEIVAIEEHFGVRITDVLSRT